MAWILLFTFVQISGDKADNIPSAVTGSLQFQSSRACTAALNKMKEDLKGAHEGLHVWCFESK